MKLSEELQKRGFVNQCTVEDLGLVLDDEKRTIYHGIDPSADSAHAGNFVVWMLLRHLADAGHKIIFLVGGGTGMIGDPKPDVERTLTPPEVVSERVTKLRAQAERILGGQVDFVNNHDWLGQLGLIDFLRDIGKHFTINELVKKDAIASRLNSEQGISYTEFAYPLLQAYDYLVLHRQYGCDVQVGGSDQWGNIVAGVDLIRRLEQKQVFAFTVPLIVDKATGKKFGKSEGNAVWLDAEKTSPYAFYQFWLNTSDESVIDYLRLFTLLSLTEIAEIEQNYQTNPGERLAQKRLAYEVTKFVHGEAAAESVKKVSGLLFGGEALETLTDAEVDILLHNAPTCRVGADMSLVDVLVESQLASSKREARTFIEGGAVELGGVKINAPDYVVTKQCFMQNLAILKRGKKQMCVLVLE